MRPKANSSKPPYWRCACGSTKVDSYQKITIVAMRHAESQHNVLGIINGDPRKQFHLTLKGKQQAKQLAKQLKSRTLTAIIASQMIRTQDTAAPLAKSKKLKVRIDPRLNDVHAGKLEGVNILKFRRLTNNINRSFQGSETATQVARRLKSFLEDVIKYYSGKTIAVVSSEIILHSLKQIAAGKFSNENIGRHIKSAKVYEFHLHRPICCPSCDDRCGMSV